MRFRRRSEADPPDQVIESPTDAEQEWVEENLRTAAALVNTFTGAGVESYPDAAQLDDAFEVWLGSWYETPEDLRDDPNPYINAFGIAFGQRLVDDVGLEWAVVTDAEGTELAVHGQPGDLLVFPTNLVAKRFVARETRFLVDLQAEIARTARGLRG